MKKILVPIDFSSCSWNALQYGKSLADDLGFSLKVVHIYTGNLNPNESLTLRPGKTRHESIEERIDEFVQKINSPQNEGVVLSKTKIETEAILAMTVSYKLLQLSKDEDVAMIVMGTTGIGNVLNKLLGSVSSAVAQRADCPVTLIPEGYKYKSFKNVLYASNYESTNENLIQQVIDFGNVFRASMHFVHVEDNDNYETVEDTIFYKLFEKGDPAFSFNIVNLKDVPVMEGLNQYASENNIDLIVLVNRQRSFLDNFFRLSLTKKMVENTTLPLMVFHLMKD